MKPKVIIRYGIFGGEADGRRLRQVLRDAGYVITHDIAAADIIIAHSAGCFWLPPSKPNQRFLLIDPPYWPGRSVAERTRSRARGHLHFHAFGHSGRAWFTRNLWVLYYGVRDFRRTLRIAQHVRTFDLEKVIADRNVTLVRNEFDDWLTPDLAPLQKNNPNMRIVTMPGDHDHLLYNPEAYINLLQSD